MVPSFGRRPLVAPARAPTVPGAHGRPADPRRRGRMFPSGRRPSRPTGNRSGVLAGAAAARPSRRIRRPPTGRPSTQGL